MAVGCWLLAIVLAFCVAPVQAQQKKKSFKERLLHYLDSSNVKGTDPAYIGLPKKKWCVMLNSATNQHYLDMSSHFEQTYESIEHPGETVFYSFDFNEKIKPAIANSIGLSVGYRGWGGGYSVSLSGNKGINMSFNIATPSNGVNIRWRRFDFSEPEVGLYNFNNNGMAFDDIEGSEELIQPMKIESFVFDGYWIFNKRRFSLAAAYGQSVLQKRSAGSFIAGMMLYYQKFDMSQPLNIYYYGALLEGTGCFKTYQGSLGAGYTYNWVPTPGLVVNAVAMPVVSLINYIKADYYKGELRNAIYDTDYTDEDIINNLDIKHTQSDSDWGSIRLNIDVRASVTYWIGNWFINAMGQIHSFSSSYNNTTIKMSNWDIKGAVGFTF